MSVIGIWRKKADDWCSGDADGPSRNAMLGPTIKEFADCWDAQFRITYREFRCELSRIADFWSVGQDFSMDCKWFAPRDDDDVVRLDLVRKYLDDDYDIVWWPAIVNEYYIRHAVISHWKFPQSCAYAVRYEFFEALPADEQDLILYNHAKAPEIVERNGGKSLAIREHCSVWNMTIGSITNARRALKDGLEWVVTPKSFLEFSGEWWADAVNDVTSLVSRVLESRI